MPEAGPRSTRRRPATHTRARLERDVRPSRLSALRVVGRQELDDHDRRRRDGERARDDPRDLVARARVLEALRSVGGSVAQTNLGNVYLRLGQADAAEQALRANPDDPDANNLLGIVASQKGDNYGAEQFFRKALQLQTDHAEAHHNLANLLATNHNYPEAAYHFQQAIAANPSYAEAHYRFGLLLLASGSIDRAQRELEETVRLKPGLAEAHRDLGDILAAKGRAREAAIEYELAQKGGHE